MLKIRAKLLSSSAPTRVAGAAGGGAFVVAALVAVVLLATSQSSNRVEASIGYFEHYGWPTYGIVKPFWMTPFSAFPSRAISGYSRKHPMRNGRGLSPFSEY